MSIILRHLALKLELDTDTEERTGCNTALVSVGTGPTSKRPQPPRRLSKQFPKRCRGIRVGFVHCPTLKMVASVEDIHIQGGGSDIVRELKGLFADVDKLKTWWPGHVDDLACLEGLEVLRLIENDVLSDDPGHFRRFALSATINATLRRDADRRDTVISAATMHSGLKLDAQFYARDLVLDAVILGFQIHHRRLQTAVNENDDPKAESPFQPPIEDDLMKRFVQLTAARNRIV